jgi:hypothetical protein
MHRTLVAFVVLAATLLAPAVASAALPPGAVPLGPAAYEIPSVLVTADGTIHVAYGEKTDTGALLLHYKRRLPGGTAFLDNGNLPIPATAKKLQGFQLIADVPRNRLLLILNDDYQAQLYVSSGLTGATWSWSGPTVIWDSFFAARSFALRASDGALGFVPELTGVYRWIVPGSLAPQTSTGKTVPTDLLTVSDRIGSRLDIDLVFDGDTMAIAFDTLTAGAFVHVSDQPASERDVKINWGGVATKTLIAACPTQGAGVLLHDAFASYDIAFVPLAAGVPQAPEVITDHRGTGNTNAPFLTAGPACTYAAAWTARDGSFVLRRRLGGTWGGFQTLLAKEFVRPASASYEDIAVGGPNDNVGAMVWFDQDSKQMVVRTFDASATDAPKPLTLPGPAPVATLKPAAATFAVSASLKLPATIVCSPSPCSAAVSLFLGAPKAGASSIAKLAGAKLTPGKAAKLSFPVKPAALRKTKWRKQGASFVAKAWVAADVVSNGEAVRVIRTVVLRASLAVAKKAKLPGS